MILPVAGQKGNIPRNVIPRLHICCACLATRVNDIDGYANLEKKMQMRPMLAPPFDETVDGSFGRTVPERALAFGTERKKRMRKEKERKETKEKSKQKQRKK